MKRDTLGTLRARIAALGDTWTDEKGTVHERPTAWAYAQACLALDRWKLRAQTAEAALRKLADTEGPHCCLLDAEGNVLIQHQCTCWRNDARVAVEGQANAK